MTKTSGRKFVWIRVNSRDPSINISAERYIRKRTSNSAEIFISRTGSRVESFLEIVKDNNNEDRMSWIKAMPPQEMFAQMSVHRQASWGPQRREGTDEGELNREQNPRAGRREKKK
jgi:hypothetical protein